jgi:O-acetyl-ADP-ribose deacetylase (regulator of RNase III)
MPSMTSAPSIELALGDITTEQVDAVVNAANSGLMGGGGVDGAILRAGGPAQRQGRRELRDRIGRLPTGRAAASPAGTMPAAWVIHVVGPVHGRGTADQLRSCFTEALRVADELGARSVAMPAVSAGVYGWPIDEVARIAVDAVRGTSVTSVTTVRFVLFSQAAYDAFEAALAER